ncbi:MAG: ribonuclease III [Aquificaceae bacterium]|nr:ribonuclease III [Aquificaceae bacterium]MDW8237255.1 ribonuclease III [Aquificaceae bacterium]
MCLKNFSKIEQLIGYTFKDKSLLERAFSHKSYSSQSYEVLEFLGDCVINLLMVELLIDKFPAKSESELALIKSFLISSEFLAELAEYLELDNFILVKQKKEEISQSVLADVFEALFGAIYTDSKDIKTVKEIFKNLCETKIISVIEEERYKKDYKTLLQEFSQQKWRERPIYRVVSVEGPEHEKTFFIECSIKGIRAIGIGSSKKRAQQDAAMKVFEAIQKDIQGGD